MNVPLTNRNGRLERGGGGKSRPRERCLEQLARENGITMCSRCSENVRNSADYARLSDEWRNHV